MDWYNLDEKEKTEVFARYTIKDFWDWWNRGSFVMEVRIKDFDLIKNTSERFRLPWSASGVYVKNDIQLKNVIAFVRDKATCWFGINPRKKNHAGKQYPMFGGGDHFISSIAYIFVDIDREVKATRPSNKKELENCNKLADLILGQLGKQKWNEDYIKICSGNGVQLLIGLDEPVLLPKVDYDDKVKGFIHNDEFEAMKKVIRKGIGEQMVKFSRKYKDELGVVVDASGLFMGKVGALPVTKNFKYEGFTWRGIIDMKKGINDGLSDHVLEYVEDTTTFNKKNVFSQRAPADKRIRPGKLRRNKLSRFLLDNDFPEGGINNTLWFQLKLLLRDSGFDLHSKEFLSFHNAIMKKHKRTFTLNLPEDNMSFNPSAVNNYCIQHGFPLVYSLFHKDVIKHDMKLENLEWEHKDYSNSSMILDAGTTILEDMDECKKKLIEGNIGNIDTVARFINACINKYGEGKTKFWFDTIFYDYLSKSLK